MGRFVEKDRISATVGGAGYVIVTIHGCDDTDQKGSHGNRKTGLTYAEAKAFATDLLADIAKRETASRP